MIFQGILTSLLALAPLAIADSSSSAETERAPIGRIDVYDIGYCQGTPAKSFDVFSMDDCIYFGGGYRALTYVSFTDTDDNYISTYPFIRLAVAPRRHSGSYRK